MSLDQGPRKNLLGGGNRQTLGGLLFTKQRDQISNPELFLRGRRTRRTETFESKRH